MKVNELVWQEMNGHFGKTWYAETGFYSNYYVHICPSNGRPKAHNVDRHEQYFDTLDAAKDWCQKDFESRVLKLVS